MMTKNTNKSGDKRDIAVVLRRRLRELMARTQLNQARLAAAAGIDRSAVAQILSEQSPRLPRAETLVRIAMTQGVSLDWLLGLVDSDTVATEVTESVAIEEGASGPDDSRLVAWRQEAVGTKVRYVPSTLPDLLRLPEVTSHEQGRRAGPSAEVRIAQGSRALDYSRSPETDMEVCMPRQQIEALAAGWGIWRGLPEEMRHAQLAHMARLADELYPTFRLYLFDERQAYSPPYTVFGLKRAALYLGESYLVVTARPAIERLSRHFDGLIRRADVASHEAAAHLEGVVAGFATRRV